VARENLKNSNLRALYKKKNKTKERKTLLWQSPELPTEAGTDLLHLSTILAYLKICLFVSFVLFLARTYIVYQRTA
jgi:hypothetical protein